MSPFGESKPPIYLGRARRKSLSARAPIHGSGCVARGNRVNLLERYDYPERALSVMRILNRMAAQYRTAIIVVTHDEKIIPTFKRIYHIRDGKTFEEIGEGRSLETEPTA